MAIVHVALKSDADAPRSAEHSDYITRQGAYAKMSRPVLVESGNMPDFAKDWPQRFWEAADVQERKNGRTYTELQIALPRELNEAQRKALAREATREFLGSRFAYTLAIHNPEVSIRNPEVPESTDKVEQPHMHLMFSERAIDDTTRTIPEERFFKRNGAKKDRKWSDYNVADEIRVKWCAMMNRAMENAGIDQRVDPRSLADQGKVVEALLVEPKMLRRGTPEEKKARRQEIAEIREAKAVLANLEIAAPDLVSIKAADLASKEKEEASVEQIESWEAEELSLLDRAIEAMKETARAVVAKVKAAVDWFVKHGYKNPLESNFYKDQPVLAIREAKQIAGRVGLSAADQARWIESGQVIADYLAEPRYQDLKTKHPHQTDAWLRNAAMGITVHYKPQQRGRSKGNTR